MNIIQQEIKVQKSAFYYTNGELTDKTEYIWFVFHGYAQRADHIIKKFNGYNSKIHHIVSIEGLSKFYWKGVTGDVVSSWMTKKNRLSEIEDYSNYLSDIYTKVVAPMRDRVKFILFGFSQGSSTVFRWVHNKNIAADVIVSWAGWIPEDISFLELNNTCLQHTQLVHVVGEEDEYLNDERERILSQIMDANKMIFDFHRFDGNHVIDRKVLSDVMSNYL